MEQLEGVPQEGRYHAKGNYDRRFILEVIKEIEEGLPGQAACTKYNLNKQSVRRWLTDPGFRHVKKKQLKQLGGPQFTNKVVRLNFIGETNRFQVFKIHASISAVFPLSISFLYSS